MEGKTIRGYEGTYYSVPETAKKLNMPASTLRNYLNRKWLDEAGIERKPEDMLELITGRKYLESSLIEKIRGALWKPIG